MGRLRNLFLLLGLTAYLLTGVAQAKGLVWCISAGGESRIEYAPQGNCEGDDPCQEAVPAEGFAHEDADHCDSCLDLPIFSESNRKNSRHASEADSNLACLPPPLSVSPAPTLTTAAAGFRPHPPPPLIPTVRDLRTVVLLN